MSVTKSQFAVDKTEDRHENCQLLFAVPAELVKEVFYYTETHPTQPEIYGNKWERHIQNDLTDEIFNIRYPGFENIIKFNDYGYYHKKP